MTAPLGSVGGTAAVDASLREFNAKLSKWAKTVPEKLVVLGHRRLTLEALIRVLRRSPVDTGRFRGNWQTTVRAPAAGEIPVAQAVARGRQRSAVIEDGRRATLALGPFESTWLSNNVPYAVPLEDGHSKQAPAGMVALTVLDLLEAFDPTPDEKRVEREAG